MENNNVHLGDLIKSKLKEMHLKPADLARRLGYSLPGTSEILKKESIQINVLQKVCKALDYDFFSHYVNCPDRVNENEASGKKNEELKKDASTPLSDGIRSPSDLADSVTVAELRKENENLKKEVEYLKKIVELYAQQKQQ